MEEQKKGTMINSRYGKGKSALEYIIKYLSQLVLGVFVILLVLSIGFASKMFLAFPYFFILPLLGAWVIGYILERTGILKQIIKFLDS